jgi:hypothetical protein
MVAANVTEFGKSRVVCFALDTLFRARHAIKSGDALAGACFLREALRRYLEAECTYYDCWPVKKYHHTPKGLLVALKKAKQCDRDGFELLADIIATCNAVVHCQTVKSRYLEGCASILLSFIDSSEAINLPKLRGEQAKWGWQCDDDEGEGWKAVTI